MTTIARQAVATGMDAAWVAGQIVEQLAAPDLKLAFIFSDWRLDPRQLAATYRALRVPVVGGTTLGVIGAKAPLGQDGITSIAAAVGVGLYGDWLRVGLGVAPDLAKSALTRSRDAVNRAAQSLGTTATALDPAKHIALTILDGTCGHEEAFCIGSAAAAPQIRFVGGCTWTVGPSRRDTIWVNGEAMHDAGAVVLLESALPFAAVTSTHVVPTDTKTVVTAASGRIIEELDGYPAAARLRQLVGQLGDKLDEPQPFHTFARYVDNVPYVRSMKRIEANVIEVAAPIEVGRVLRVMRPGDLIGTTRRDLAVAAERVGGIGAFIAFSCHGRHWEARMRRIERDLVESYAAYPTIGFETSGEQSGMLLVNHTLAGVAIGAPK
ncbi:MAG: FIST signal transduction protein [Kofleriaceae bacterium]